MRRFNVEADAPPPKKIAAPKKSGLIKNPGHLKNPRLIENPRAFLKNSEAKPKVPSLRCAENFHEQVVKLDSIVERRDPDAFVAAVRAVVVDIHE